MTWCCEQGYPSWLGREVSRTTNAGLSFYLDPHTARIVQTNVGAIGHPHAVPVVEAERGYE